ncbi:hypothetical protein J4226_04930 [Candidatus Pacearchaeota archaeon]|nr:hypothetical protein [Candidatus Pacearchaeota archaeon]
MKLKMLEITGFDGEGIPAVFRESAESARKNISDLEIRFCAAPDYVRPDGCVSPMIRYFNYEERDGFVARFGEDGLGLIRDVASGKIF